MKLYKFRSFGSYEEFKRVIQIIENGKFYMANWPQLNDPMEGYFYYFLHNIDPNPMNENIRTFIKYKSEFKVCSFANTYHPMLLWSHYADSQKGIAIEIELNSKNYNSLHRVKYIKNIPELDFQNIQDPITVLTKKIKYWAYEKEYRFIDTNPICPTVKITAIYFGIRTEVKQKQDIIDALKNSYDDKVYTYDTTIDFTNNNIICRL